MTCWLQMDVFSEDSVIWGGGVSVAPLPLQCICIAGLPGSGKSHYGRYLCGGDSGESRFLPGRVFLDDPTDLAQLDAIHARSGAYADASCSRLVVSDPYFCRTQVRDAAVHALKARWPTAQISWVFFANDPDAAIANVLRRNDGRKVLDFLRKLSAHYEIPEPVPPAASEQTPAIGAPWPAVQILPVWRVGISSPSLP